MNSKRVRIEKPVKSPMLPPIAINYHTFNWAIVKTIDLIVTSKEAASSLTIEEKVGDRNATFTR